MAIKDLEVRQGKVELIATVSSKTDPREFNKFGKQGRVCNAKVRDETGEVTLTLWNEDIDKVNVGDRIQIKNGYVSEWQGEKQLSTGKFGTLEVLEGGASPEPTTAAAAHHQKSEHPKPSGEEDDTDKEESEEDLDVDEEDVI